MRRHQSLLISAAAAALAITAMGAPVTAAPGKGTIAIVNGAPGRAVDVCINGREIRSGLRYGQKWVRDTFAGAKAVKFYSRNRHSCRGTLLGRRTIALTAASRHTVVLTRKSPGRVVAFGVSSATAALPAAPAVFGVLRHAADVGPAYFSWELHNVATTPVEPVPVDPTLVSPFIKGQSSEQLNIYAADPALMILRASSPLSASPFVRPTVFHLKLLRWYDWILVGTTTANARFVSISYPISFS